jgi:hypothetical protein
MWVWQRLKFNPTLLVERELEWVIRVVLVLASK